MESKSVVKRRMRVILASGAFLAAAGFWCMMFCQSAGAGPKDGKVKGAKTMTFSIDSDAFDANGPIPKKYTGDGADVSPPLSWSNLPPGTKELALIVDDPDAPTPQPWVHWVIYKIPAETPDLQEGIKKTATVQEPAGALQGVNSWNTTGYRGPAPPPGKVHHYYFKLYALEAPLKVKAGLDKAALKAAMKGHVLGEAKLMGTYQR